MRRYVVRTFIKYLAANATGIAENKTCVCFACHVLIVAIKIMTALLIPFRVHNTSTQKHASCTGALSKHYVLNYNIILVKK